MVTAIRVERLVEIRRVRIPIHDELKRHHRVVGFFHQHLAKAFDQADFGVEFPPLEILDEPVRLGDGDVVLALHRQSSK
jgi:hypothetical protein